MKLWGPSNHQKFRRKPFLVLPLLIENSIVENSQSMGLKLGTSGSLKSSASATWPPKIKKRKSKSLDRPRTATLDKPKLLNLNLIQCLDMSMVTKELLTITNLCQPPVTATTESPRFAAPTQSTEPRKTSEIKRVKKTVISSSEEDNSIILPKPKRQNTVKICSLRDPPKAYSEKDHNNNRNEQLRRTHKSRKDKLNELSASNTVVYLLESAAKLQLPEPCKTCGRTDQPERFHSHPTTPKAATVAAPPPPGGDARPHTKSFPATAAVPRYKSRSPVTERKKVSRSPYLQSLSGGKKAPAATRRPNSAPRKPPMKTCYLCGREFGTASLPLHEPKCLEKWERENEKLPANLRRDAPPKPDKNLSAAEYNEFAWKTAQANLVPCENCGRTFLPDRLSVHQRSCRPQLSPTSSSGWTSPGHGPPTVPCYICGRKFGTKSIGIHEPQCLKKWHAHNEHLPAAQRTMPPVKPDGGNDPSTPISFQKLEDETVASIIPKPPRQRNTVACYLCGRDFIPRSLKIHEPQCLEKWRNENAKLPISQRRKEPQRPDIVFTENGRIDFEAMNEINWKSHLSQLVPCSKCSRTFNPDRVDIHERNCKGPTG